ncbi:MAG TPA: type IV pilus secretin PilQ [Desulfomicrobiaceae bacterium]|nr:type IV pilus secretin PilQ [Desulfomicrobiaceae bacterium]
MHTAKQATPGDSPSPSPATGSWKPEQIGEGGRVDLAVSGKHTVLSLPVPAGTDVSPQVKGKTLRLAFSPALPALHLPEKGTGLILSLAGDPSGSDSGSVASLQVMLSGNFQFMFSRPSPDILRVYFLPDRSGSSEPVVDTEKSSQATVRDIGFTQNEQGHLLVRLKADTSLQPLPLPAGDDRIRILLPNVSVPAWYAKLYKLHKFSTEARSVLLRNGSDGAELLFSVQNRVPMQIISSPEGVLITLHTSSTSLQPIPVPADSEHRSGDSAKSALKGDGNHLQELNTLFPGMKSSYTGSRVSLDFQDADVEHVLRLLAEVSGYNLILDQGVTGTISLKLKDLPWDHALDLILLQKGLGMVLKGNIMRIATAKKLEEERNQFRRAREAALEAQESLENLAPLETAYIQVNYSTAAELESKVREFLSPRGKVSPDSRTNILIVSDTGTQLDKIRRVLEKLDRPERQVRIEARIVYATDEFKRNLGLKWGGSYDPETAANLAGEQWSNGVELSGLNLPTAVTDFAVTGNIAKVMGEDLFALDMELQLGETTGISKTISSPKVVTLNNKEAEIEQTTQIPYNTLDDAGNTITEFKEAPLKLRVTPQITPDNKLLLDIEVNDDTATTSASSEEPAIESKRIQSKLIVNDKETIVIGGIQRVTRTNSQNRIPGAADVPVLGWLFKNKGREVSKQELLVFIRCEVL